MEGDDWANLLMLGDDVAMQWYVLTHPGTALPAPAPGGEIQIPGVARASFNTNLLIIGAIIVAVVLLNK